MPDNDSIGDNKYTVIGSVQLNISDGGVRFSLDDGPYGPTLRIHSSHFGHQTNGMELLLHPDAITDLRDLFTKAADHKFTGKLYCYAIGQHRKPAAEGGCCGGDSCCKEKQ